MQTSLASSLTGCSLRLSSNRWCWRRARSLGSEEDWLRIMVPFNMREFKHRKMPAPTVLVSSVDRERRFTNSISWPRDPRTNGSDSPHNLGLTFQAFLNLRACQWGRPSGTARFVRRWQLLTNLGRPFRRSRLPEKEGKICPGNLVLQDYELMLRCDQTHLSFAAFRYAGKRG